MEADNYRDKWASSHLLPNIVLFVHRVLSMCHTIASHFTFNFFLLEYSSQSIQYLLFFHKHCFPRLNFSI